MFLASINTLKYNIILFLGKQEYLLDCVLLEHLGNKMLQIKYYASISIIGWSPLVKT